jgi:hypothetical protein
MIGILITLILVIGLFFYFWFPYKIRKVIDDYEEKARYQDICDELDEMIALLEQKDEPKIYYTTLHTMN